MGTGTSDLFYTRAAGPTSTQSMGLWSQNDLETSHCHCLQARDVGCSPKMLSWVSSHENPSGQLQTVASVQRKAPLLPPPRQEKGLCKASAGSGHLSNCTAPKSLGSYTTSRICPRSESIRMPGPQPQAAHPRGELGLLISFQTGGDVRLSISPLPHRTTYFVHEFSLPSLFSAQKIPKISWRRRELSPQQWCQE